MRKRGATSSTAVSSLSTTATAAKPSSSTAASAAANISNCSVTIFDGTGSRRAARLRARGLPFGVDRRRRRRRADRRRPPARRASPGGAPRAPVESTHGGELALQALAHDELEDLEGVLAGALVALVPAHDPAQLVRRHDGGRREPPPRPRRLAGAGDADEHHQARVRQPDAHGGWLPHGQVRRARARAAAIAGASPSVPAASPTASTGTPRSGTTAGARSTSTVSS